MAEMDSDEALYHVVSSHRKNHDFPSETRLIMS